MRYCTLSFLVLACIGCQHFSKPRQGYDYCYAAGRGLYIGRYGHEPVRVFVNGTDARLSPDGTCIAYTDAGAPDHQRRIGVLDLEAGKVTLLDTGCHNCYGPVWSPDGSYLAYNAFTGKDWSIKYIDRKGQHPVLLVGGANSPAGYYSPTWSADGSKIAAHDMNRLNVYDLGGNVLRSIVLREMDPSTGFSSASTFALTDKENKVVYWGSVKDGDDEGAAVFVYDWAIDRCSRISPKGFDCRRPVIEGDTIFCRGRHSNSGKENTYRMDIDGGHFKLAYREKVDISFAER
jgi:TolB protein